MLPFQLQIVLPMSNPLAQARAPRIDFASKEPDPSEVTHAKRNLTGPEGVNSCLRLQKAVSSVPGCSRLCQGADGFVPTAGEAGKIAEHWQIGASIPSPATRKNPTAKFERITHDDQSYTSPADRNRAGEPLGHPDRSRSWCR